MTTVFTCYNVSFHSFDIQQYHTLLAPDICHCCKASFALSTVIHSYTKLSLQAGQHNSTFGLFINLLQSSR